MTRSHTIDELLERVSPPRGVAAVASVDESGSIDIRGAWSALTGLFEVGSLTKTMTATLLATLTLDGIVSLDTTVGEILGRPAGNEWGLRLVELATHTSGLPRLPPNAVTFPWWPRDPYRFYDERRLFEGLSRVALERRGEVSYSNLGFDLLGCCLATAAGQPLNQLLTTRVLRPAGMHQARCQPCPSRGLLRGHGSLLLGGSRWHKPLPGAGGVDCTINDLAAWARANLLPESTPLTDAVRLAQHVHATSGNRHVRLGWHSRNSLLWHNGGTGSFQSVVIIEPRSRAIAALATLGPSRRYSLDERAMRWIHDASDCAE